MNTATHNEPTFIDGAQGQPAPDAVAEFLATVGEAAFGSLVGMPLGRRERQAGHLRTIAEIHIEAVVEYSQDLAIADRIAYIWAWRTGTAHVVVAHQYGYVVCRPGAQLELGDLVPYQGHPPVVTFATPTHVTPVMPDSFP